jgi:hypothetical protein
MMEKTERTTIFISKGTPEDDDFVLWLAPRLEAQGYKIFADILSLEPGDRWRRELTNALQTKAAKMLLCCRDVTLAKNGVQEEIGIAEDLVKEMNDPRYIIPLRLEKFKKVFGIGELQYVNFTGRWASGLLDLLDTLATQNVPCDPGRVEINPNWEIQYAEWAQSSDVPPTIVAERGGDLTYGQFSLEGLQRRFLEICDLIPDNVNPDAVCDARQAIQTWVPMPDRHLEYQVGGHGSVMPISPLTKSALDASGLV